MAINYEKWHDGASYDIAAIRAANPAERAEMEQTLVARGVHDWRDVEALAAIDSPNARALLKKALNHSDASIVAAVVNYAPQAAAEAERAEALAAALGHAAIGKGLIETLREVKKFHPPVVIDALLRGVLARDNATAARFATMLLFLHGQVPSEDALQTEFYTPDRAAPFRKLCARIGADPARYLKG